MVKVLWDIQWFQFKDVIENEKNEKMKKWENFYYIYRLAPSRLCRVQDYRTQISNHFHYKPSSSIFRWLRFGFEIVWNFSAHFEIPASVIFVHLCYFGDPKEMHRNLENFFRTSEILEGLTPLSVFVEQASCW